MRGVDQFFIEKIEANGCGYEDFSKMENLFPWCDSIASVFARKYFYNREVEISDYKNTAVIGLTNALKNYDPNKGKLKPYCFKYMYHELSKLAVRSNSYQLKKVDVELFAENNDTDELFNFVEDTSMNSTRNESFFESMANDIDMDKVIDLLKYLSEEQRTVIIEHYYNQSTLKEISRLMSVSPSRVSQIHRAALKELNVKLGNNTIMNQTLSYEETLNLAAYSVKNNELSSALKLCKSLTFEQVPDQRLKFIEAAIYNQLGMYDQAITLYETVISKGYDNELIHFQLGVAYFNSNRLESALEVWQKAPYFEGFCTGLKLAKSQHYVEAIDALEPFINANDQFPEVNIDAQNLVEAIKSKVGNQLSKSIYDIDTTTTQSANIPDPDDALLTDGPVAPKQKDVSSLLSIYQDK